MERAWIRGCKGIRKLDEQGNMVKSLRGAKEQRKFQRERGNTDDDKFKLANMAAKTVVHIFIGLQAVRFF